MKKIIEEGAFRAEVDVSNLDNVKIAITMRAPLYVSDYKPNEEPWDWSKDIGKEAHYLQMEVESFIRRAQQAGLGLRRYAV